MTTLPGAPLLHLMARAGRLCAIPIEAAVEATPLLPIEPTAGAAQGVLGLALVRGEAMPVVDVAELLTGERSAPRCFVIARSGPRRAALAVDDVAGIRGLDAGAVEGGRALAEAMGCPPIASIVACGAEAIAVLDVARVPGLGEAHV